MSEIIRKHIHLQLHIVLSVLVLRTLHQTSNTQIIDSVQNDRNAHLACSRPPIPRLFPE